MFGRPFPRVIRETQESANGVVVKLCVGPYRLRTVHRVIGLRQRKAIRERGGNLWPSSPLMPKNRAERQKSGNVAIRK